MDNKSELVDQFDGNMGKFATHIKALEARQTKHEQQVKHSFFYTHDAKVKLSDITVAVSAAKHLYNELNTLRNAKPFDETQFFEKCHNVINKYTKQTLEIENPNALPQFPAKSHGKSYSKTTNCLKQVLDQPRDKWFLAGFPDFCVGLFDGRAVNFSKYKTELGKIIGEVIETIDEGRNSSEKQMLRR